MEWLKRMVRRIYGSYCFADVSLFFLRRFLYRLPSGLFESPENMALHHPRPAYPAHALIVPKRRVYAPYNWEADELEHTLRDGLRAAKLLSPKAYSEALVWINGGCFQTFSQAHAHVYPRKTPIVTQPVDTHHFEGYTLTECTRYGSEETSLLIFTAQENLFERFVDAFYHEIMPAYALDARGYSIYISTSLPADPAMPIDSLFIRMGARSAENQAE